MFLPDCNNRLCGGCVHLPHTITAKFAGFDQTMVRNATSIPGVSCSGAFGEGASVGIAAPGDTKGPVTSAFVLTPGKCYATHGRVAPTLSVSSSDAKADFSVTVEQFTSQCRPAWKVSSIAVKNGQSLPDQSFVSVVAAPGDVTAASASGKVSQSGGGTSITLTSAGSYYRPAKNKRDIPVLTATTSNGVRLRPGIRYNAGDPPTWSVDGISILYSGQGISDDELPVSIIAGDRTHAVDGEVAKAVVNVKDGKASSVSLTTGGRYYRDTDVPPLVADVTFSLSCGAVLEGVVEDDPVSKEFGQVVGVNVESAGSNCQGWENSPPRCIDRMNGREIVLRAVDSEPLIYICPDADACFGSGAVIEPIFRKAPLLIGSVDTGSGVFSAELYLAENVGDDSQTWGVSRVRGHNAPVYSVGQQVEVAFASPVPQNPADFYSLQTRVMRTKMDVAADITISQIELDPDFPLLTTGYVAAVTINNPGKYYEETGDWDGVPGPIRHIRIVRQGSGYATRGREQPTVTAGIGGSLGVTLTQSKDKCDRPFWEVKSISLAGATAGYVEGGALTFSTPDVQSVFPLVVVHTREEPTVTASVAGGSPAAALTVSLNRTPPSGSWPPSGPQSTPAVWSVSSVQVESPGAKYQANASIPVAFTTPHSGFGAAATAATNENGEVVAVSVSSGGQYFRNRGIPQEFTIVSRGAFYKESNKLDPYVGLDALSVVQTLPSNGSGAVLTAEIDEDPISPSFGRVIGVDIEKSGNNYRFRSGSCTYRYACIEKGQIIDAVLRNGEIDLTLSGGSTSEDGTLENGPTIWRGLFRSDSKASPCEPFHAGPYVSQYEGMSGSITLEAGGEYDAKEPCCYCPCDLGPHPFDLFPCGISSIVVEISVATIDGSCPSETVTLTLEPGIGSSTSPYWSSSLATESWSFSAQLECLPRSRFAISAGANPFPCGVFGGGIGITVPLEASRDALGEQCCPQGDEASLTSGNYEISVTVSVVEA